MEIGEPQRTFTVEPLEDPVPRERPTTPEEPAEDADGVADEPEHVPT